MLQNEDRQRIAVIAEEISDYLSGRPDAKDSLEGILMWWLTRQRYQESVQLVREAVRWLLERGVIMKRVMPDGRIVYSAQRSTLLQKD